MIVYNIKNMKLRSLILASFILISSFYSEITLSEVVKSESKDNRFKDKYFQRLWDEIKLCNIKFYLPTGEEGLPLSYLRSRGYQVIDTGDGLLKVPNISEQFYGFKVLSLTLPGEWQSYDIEIKTTADNAYKKIFKSKGLRPYLKFKDRYRFNGNDSGIRYIKNWDAQDQHGYFHVVLTISDTPNFNNEPVSTITCSLEYGN